LRRFVLILLLAACAEKPVDLRDGWTVTGLAPEGLDVALTVAHDLAPCSIEPWGGDIDFVEGPVDCYGVPGTGCWFGDDEDAYRMDVGVAYSPEPMTACREDGYCKTHVLDRVDRTALFHELNHFIVPYCTDSTWGNEPDASYEIAMNAEWRARMGL
jgi:hypothetical protein